MSTKMLRNRNRKLSPVKRIGRKPLCGDAIAPCLTQAIPFIGPVESRG